MIDVNDKINCSGCTACQSICPQKAIQMIEDKEGFLYPQINKEKCINCNLCNNVCPVKNASVNIKKQKAYIFQNSNDEIRRESTSGGAFSAIAEYIISKNGIVYGAMFDENFKVIHDSVESIDGLAKFRNSKYVQSDLNNCFIRIKDELNKGRYVCFSGTSCQIEGLKRFLNKDYSNLLLVDVVCRAVPSPLVWEKYLELRKKRYKDITKILFRDKYYGYKYSNLSIYTKENISKLEYHSGVETDPYLRAFFSNICDRPSCYDCKFKKQYRESDLTIWDCFDVEKFNKNKDDDKGTTRIMTNTQKGEEVIDNLKINNFVEEISVDKALNEFNHIFNKVKMNPKRTEFFEDVTTKDAEEVFNKYFPNNFKCKLEKNTRILLIKFGVYKPLLKLGKKIRKRK